MTATLETTAETTVAELTMNAYEGEWIGNVYLNASRLWGDERLYVIVADDAFKNKAVCPSFSVEVVDKSQDCFLLNSDWMDQSLEDLVDCLMSLEFEKGRFGSYNQITIDGLTIHREDLEAKRVFNPNAVSHLKPVKKLPEVGKTVRLPTVVKLLVNGQVTAFHDQKLTDDYAYDNATNFGKGDASCMALAEKLVNSPSGWRSYMQEDGKLLVACHHFDYYTLTVTDPKLL